MVTQDGYELDDGIHFPDQTMAVSIDRKGKVYAHVAGQDDLQEVGQIKLYTFPNPNGLDAIGDNLFVLTPASGDAASGEAASKGYGEIIHKYVEASNVNLIKQITDMIDYHVLYDANSKVVEADRDMKRTDVALAGG
jgi:flagellar basal-body rod protein FlgG